MDRNEAASVIRRYLTCTDITHSCNGKCEACRYHTNDDEKELALKLAIKALEQAPKWIPVSERLPIKEFEEGFKNGTVYDLYPCLVSRTAKHSPVNPDRIYVAKHYFDGEDFLNVGAQVVTDEVIAWMPLPEPYRKEP